MIIREKIPLVLLIIKILFVPGHIHAQEEPVPVKRSEDKVMLEGKIYYIHVVKEGQTLYSISKAYNVTERIIAVENPDVFAGLLAGMVLKIPAEPVAEVQDYDLESDDFIYHIIREGDTLYSLSMKYGVPLSEIIKYNREVEHSDLQINQVIRIPKMERGTRERNFRDNDFVYHYVRKGETLFSLSKFYGVNSEDIKELNPELRLGGLKYDRYIRIPVTHEAGLLQDSLRQDTFWDTTACDSLFIYREQWEKMFRDSLFTDTVRETLDVGLFLPLLIHWQEYRQREDTVVLWDSAGIAGTRTNGKEADQEQVDEEGDKGTEELTGLNPMTTGFLEFYEGVLLGLDSLKKRGISVNLHVFDTEKNPDKLTELLGTTDVSGFDLILGPVDPRNLKIVSGYSNEYMIPMVSPFYTYDELIRDNPFFIQVPPSSSVELKKYASYLSGFYDKNLIFVHNPDSPDSVRTIYFRKEILGNIYLRTDTLGVVFKEALINDSLPALLSHTLAKDTQNIVIVPSMEEAEVSRVLSALYFLLEEYDIKVFGMYNWQKFRSIDLEYYHKLHLHYLTSFYVDYEEPAVRDYLRKYNMTYHTEPYRIASRGYNISMLGYDAIMYFVPLVKEYGKNLIFNLNRGIYQPIMGNYEFVQLHDFSGQVNQSSQVVRYRPDISIDHFQPDLHPSGYQVFPMYPRD